MSDMPEISELVTESETGSRTAVLERDLTCLLEVGYALRSVPESDIELWVKGQERCGAPPRPHKQEVTLLRDRPVETNKYEVVVPSGEIYTLVVEPIVKPDAGVRIHNNKVTIRFSKKYFEGPNSSVSPAPPNEHRLSALLQVIGNLPSEYASLDRDNKTKLVPLKFVSFDNVVELVKAYNGFRTDKNNPVERNPFFGIARFHDANFECQCGLKPEKLNVYVDIERGYAHGGNYIEMSLRVVLPEKRDRTFLTKIISLKGRKP